MVCEWTKELQKKRVTRRGRIGMVVGPVVTLWATYAATISPPELHAYPKKKKNVFLHKTNKNDTQHGQVGVVVRPVVTPRATYAATISSPELHTHPNKTKQNKTKKKAIESLLPISILM